jgi:prepilin-type N-terminal cleavage/methylation domain-containing protein
MTGERGFSLVELLVASMIFACAAGLLFGLITNAQGAGRSQPDAADVNQRLRVAAAAIERDLVAAGASPTVGGAYLANYMPPIRPARTGANGADGEFQAFSDRISMVRAAHDGWATRIAADMATAASDVPLAAGAQGCQSPGLCGFEIGTRALILDAARLGSGYELFTVTGIVSGLGHGPPNPSFSKAYSVASGVVLPVVEHVYYLDAVNRRLMLYDGFKTTMPLVDNVVALEFEYFLDPLPSAVPFPPDPVGNCGFAPGDPPVPLLAALPGATLHQAALTEFTDGPYCGAAPHRFDVDLLRIRRVRATIRVQAAADQLRGKGGDFTNAGTSDHAATTVRDFEVTFDTAPRNLRPIR